MACPICESVTGSTVCQICLEVYQEDISHHRLPPGLEDISRFVTEDDYPYEIWENYKVLAKQRSRQIITYDTFQWARKEVAKKIRKKYECRVTGSDPKRLDTASPPSKEKIQAYVRHLG